MARKLNLLLTILLVTLTLSHSGPTRPEPISDKLKNSKGDDFKNNKGYDSRFHFPPGSAGNDMPFPGGGSGYGGGYSGASKARVVRPTVVCKEKGRCYMKKLTCPAKCFKSFSSSDKGYGGRGGGGGGGCTIDCEKNCVAYC